MMMPTKTVAIDYPSLEPRLARVAAQGYADVVDALRDFLPVAKAVELVGVNTTRFARERGIKPVRVLRAFLSLTAEGVFDLSWTVHCPHCKGTSQCSVDLKDLHSSSHCRMCAVDYEAGFDRNVHLAFRAAPAVATLGEIDPFEEAMAGFELEPGVSFELEPGDKRFISLAVSPGNYLAADLGNRAVLNLAVNGNMEAGHRDYRWRLEDSTMGVTVSALGPGTLKLFMHNDSKKTREIRFARLRGPDWPDAFLVSTLQEFRDFFTDDALSPGESFDIRSVSIVFTDIKGSTAMYERLGDAKAFWLIKEHFRIMEDIVRKREGALVKTIGDAVMAVFHRPADAASAARDMIEAFDTFNAPSAAAGREGISKDEIIIKVGAHSGPCIAVTLNGRLDYFGSSVNIAARIQGLSDGRDIMLSERLYEEARAAELFAEGWSAERFTTSLKGIADERAVWKLAQVGA